MKSILLLALLLFACSEKPQLYTDTKWRGTEFTADAAAIPEAESLPHPPVSFCVNCDSTPRIIAAMDADPTLIIYDDAWSEVLLVRGAGTPGVRVRWLAAHDGSTEWYSPLHRR